MSFSSDLTADQRKAVRERFSQSLTLMLTAPTTPRGLDMEDIEKHGPLNIKPVEPEPFEETRAKSPDERYQQPSELIADLLLMADRLGIRPSDWDLEKAKAIDQASLWDAWCRAHPVKQVKEQPKHFFSQLYNRQQAEQHCDGYEEQEDVPCRVVLCQADGTYYIVPDKE